MRLSYRLAVIVMFITQFTLVPVTGSTALAAREQASAKPHLGPLPTNCPRGPTPRPHAPGFTIVGGSPVWTHFLVGSGPSPLAPTSGHKRWGWEFKLGWSLEPDAKSSVTIRGWNIKNGKPIWFASNDSQGVVRRLVIDPQKAQNEEFEGWLFFPAEMYVPSAGCYAFYAQWKDGGWILPFSVGQKRSQ